MLNLERGLKRPGMIYAGGPVVRAFSGIGWAWADASSALMARARTASPKWAVAPGRPTGISDAVTALLFGLWHVLPTADQARVIDGGIPDALGTLVAVAGTVSYDATSQVASIVASAAAGFAPSRTFAVTLQSGATGVKDLAGNALPLGRRMTLRKSAMSSQSSYTGVRNASINQFWIAIHSSRSSSTPARMLEKLTPSRSLASPL